MQVRISFTDKVTEKRIEFVGMDKKEKAYPNEYAFTTFFFSFI